MLQNRIQSLVTGQAYPFDPVPIKLEEHRCSVSIIIPTLNEIENIDNILADIISQMSGDYDFEIIVADGGSRDGTIDQVVRWQTDGPISFVQGGGSGGLAADVVAAAHVAKFPILVVLDADGSHPVAALPGLIAPIYVNEFDMVIGSRNMEGGSMDGWPLRRRILSRVGGALAWPFTDAADPMSGFFAIRRESLLAVSAKAEGFKIALEAINAGGDTLRVTEVPIRFTDRTRGTSKIGIRQFAAYLRRLYQFSGGSDLSRGTKRFAIVGAMGFLIDLLIVTVLQDLGANLRMANVCGFCFSATFNYLANARWSFPDRQHYGHGVIRYLLVAALALAIRTGFLVDATAFAGLPKWMGIVAGILGGGIVSYIGSAFFIFRTGAYRSGATSWKLKAIAIFLYVVVLRIVYQGNIDLIPEEAYYWNYAQHLDWGYLDHPPMVAWLMWIGTKLFGASEFGVRAAATACWMATAYFGFRLALNLFGRTEAFITVILISTLPFFFAIGLVITPDAPLTAAWAGGLFYLERALIGERRKAWIGAGIVVGLGMLSKYTIALLVPASLVFLILRPEARRWLLTPWPYLSAFIAALLFSPVIGWNAAHDWASFVFQGTRRWTAAFHFSFHSLIGFVTLLIGPVGLFSVVITLWRLARSQDRLSHSVRSAFILTYTLVPLAVFVIFSLFHGVKMNWTGPLWLAALPAIAHFISTHVRDARPTRLVRSWNFSTAFSLISFSAILTYVAIGLPLLNYSGSLRGLPVAWEEFAEKAEQIGNKVAADTGSTPMLIGMDTYHIASELAFYLRRNTALEMITSQNLLGGNGLMFREWLPDTSFGEGRVVVMFGFKASDIADEVVADRFESTGPVIKSIVMKGGSIAGEFFYRVGYGLRVRSGSSSTMAGTFATTPPNLPRMWR
ncbi:glycosyltransferase family 39 protein [Mesorhizobium sp. M2E.F.Ca.ET.219.01.1.1]|uniref:glycosyltransferase family 39 protein n=1 Tax=Mesorhizobium sp. M2E.F.Ca.ET.219.01.1.1 TaxID=2500530 RepID=UPI000FDC4A5B|nr:glycosyltransferase family 39 protein [Mesorhizobium sp. M2E.F.Ca.ET.219.01.1.1]TGQ04467.1 glycosyltransferase [Mesorhizobium sp. M2E.F.Ca.ET.219.01.1.1]